MCGLCAKFPHTQRSALRTSVYLMPHTKEGEAHSVYQMKLMRETEKGGKERKKIKDFP